MKNLELGFKKLRFFLQIKQKNSIFFKLDNLISPNFYQFQNTKAHILVMSYTK